MVPKSRPIVPVRVGPAADQVDHRVRAGVGGEVEVDLRCRVAVQPAEQRVADRAAHQGELVTGRGEPAAERRPSTGAKPTSASTARRRAAATAFGSAGGTGDAGTTSKRARRRRRPPTAFATEPGSGLATSTVGGGAPYSDRMPRPRPRGRRSRRPRPAGSWSTSCDGRARAAVIARVNRAGRLEWCLPKGHLEGGETPEQAAVREIAEETGIHGRVLRRSAVDRLLVLGRRARIHKTVHHYLLEAIGGELSVEGDPDAEAVDAAWVPLDELDGPARLRQRAADRARRAVAAVGLCVSARSDRTGRAPRAVRPPPAAVVTAARRPRAAARPRRRGRRVGRRRPPRRCRVRSPCGRARRPRSRPPHRPRRRACRCTRSAGRRGHTARAAGELRLQRGSSTRAHVQGGGRTGPRTAASAVVDLPDGLAAGPAPPVVLDVPAGETGRRRRSRPGVPAASARAARAGRHPARGSARRVGTPPTPRAGRVVVGAPSAPSSSPSPARRRTATGVDPTTWPR